MKRILSLLTFAALLSHTLFAAQLKGKVTNEKGEPLEGATVRIVNYAGTATNALGEFTFKDISKETYQLLVTYIGYKNHAAPIKITSESTVISITLEPTSILQEDVIVTAIKADKTTPVAFTNISKAEINSKNMGQDIPYLLSMTPSLVATSDAGAGVGYTNFRIRGTDMNRTNVTINGIPMNDAESHGTWFVDIPDLAASTENIQIQRGVGTSTNGAAAFGASINLQTSTPNAEPYAELHSAGGSFNTFRNSVAAGTGLINDKFAVDVRLSKVTSDGYIDRASSDLKSFFVSGGYFGDKTVVKLNIFSGFEETYQAWYGVPSELINTDRTYNYYTYENQVDHYQQDHYQLHITQEVSPNLKANLSGHYTYGRGYYEEFKNDEDLADYDLTSQTLTDANITSTDLVRRKWLDNDFYGATASLIYTLDDAKIVAGGAYNEYDGRHFGKVIWAQHYGDLAKNHEWYRGTGLKKDASGYIKGNLQLLDMINLYADVQYRHIDYTIDGRDDDDRLLDQKHTFDFINPKAGIVINPTNEISAYASYARANREPNRSNFIDADPASDQQPTFETLNDFEAGASYNQDIFAVSANAYYMSYNDQLVLTGEINDVGSGIMVNVDDSYRAGIELQATIKPNSQLQWTINGTLSQNKIKNFTEYVDNWDTGLQKAYILGETDIAFSPEIIANSTLQYKPLENLGISLLTNYVGEQFIDNTSNNDRKLDAYLVNGLKVDYIVPQTFFKEVSLHFIANNILDEKYENNAWVYSYLQEGNRYKMDGLYPQAGRNFMAKLSVKF